MIDTLHDKADRQPRAKIKAIVFTHIDLNPKEIDQKGQRACIDEYIPLFERYLECSNVGLVYLYLSLGAEKVIKAIVDGEKLAIPPEVLIEEDKCRYILSSAENKARRKYPDRALEFVHITSRQLASLFRNLHEIDPSLITFLAGIDEGKDDNKKEVTFGYDSPKFIEAVIRIARGQDPRSAYYPVVRFDEDVHVGEESLDLLLKAYEEFLVESDNLYFFFSGAYGDPDHPNEIDPINDRAVRVHWFVEKTDKQFQPEIDKIRLFWRDLGEVGATQLPNEAPPSLHGQSLIAERGIEANRQSCQVISGAGLIMSLRAIQDLPPFMNLSRLIVWVDDHLKRELHEMIGDISCHELECVDEAIFKQNRHPYGISEKDIAWAQRDYFERLLAGCMMDSIISQPTIDQNGIARMPTEFSKAIKDIIARPPIADEIDCELMKPSLQAYAEQRYDLVLSLWQTPEFEGTVLYKWAKERNEEYRKKQIEEIVEDACRYLELVKLWRVTFAAAIGRLKPLSNLWLFQRVG